MKVWSTKLTEEEDRTLKELGQVMLQQGFIQNSTKYRILRYILKREINRYLKIKSGR